MIWCSSTISHYFSNLLLIDWSWTNFASTCTKRSLPEQSPGGSKALLLVLCDTWHVDHVTSHCKHPVKMATVKSPNFLRFSFKVLLVFSLFGSIKSSDIPAPYAHINIAAEEYPLPVLPYGYKDLEPYIDRETVEAHHSGHHAAYTNKMNTALKAWRNEVHMYCNVL